MKIQTAFGKPGWPKKRPQAQPYLNQITVLMPPDIVSALDHELAPLGMRSRSELIREARQTYLEQRKEQAGTVSLAR